MDKYKELFNLALESYHEQHTRYEGMSDKASKYLTALTLMIGLFSILGKIMLDGFSNHNKTCIEWYLIIIGLIMFLLLLLTWLYLLRVLRLEQLYVIPMDDKTISFYDDNKLIDIYFAMSKGIKDAVLVNEKIIETKSSLLGIAYKLVRLYTLLFLIFSILYLIFKWNF